MATDLRLFDITLDASGDHTSDQYKAVVPSTASASGEFAVVTAAAGGRFIGVLQDKSTAAGIASLIRVAGITKMQAGASSGMTAALKEGDVVVASTLGQAVVSTASGTAKMGITLDALGTTSTGIIRVLLGVGLTT